MKILEIRPTPRSGGGRFKDIAYFDAQISDGLRLIGLRLVEAPDGRRLVYAPSKHGRSFATFGAEFATEIVAAVSAEMGGRESNDCNSR